ncbi:hypothetical protein ACOSOMT5_P2184 [Acidiphilium sp. MT5]
MCFGNLVWGMRYLRPKDESAGPQGRRRFAAGLIGRIEIPAEFSARAKIIHLDNWAKNSFMTAIPGGAIAFILLLQCVAPLQHSLDIFCFASIVVGYTIYIGVGDWWLNNADQPADLARARQLMFATRFGLSTAWAIFFNVVVRAGGDHATIIVVGTEIALISATMIVGPLTFGLAALWPLVIGAVMSVGPGAPVESSMITGAMLVYGLYTFYAFGFLSRKMIIETLTTIRLEQTNETIRILLRDFEESASDWLWETDSAFNLASVSPRFAEVAQRDPEKMVGPLIDVLRGDGPPEPGSTEDPLAPLLDQFAQLAPLRDLVIPIVIGGERRWWLLTGKPILEGPNQRFVGYRGVGSDVTDSHQAREQNAYLARHDVLTGLANRVAFTDALEQAMTAKRGALLSLDLDAFKAVNDRFGHSTGDLVLSAVAHRIRGAIRDGDLAARLGGDEFAILLDTDDDNEVRAVAKRIVNILGRSFKFEDITVEIGTSIGITLVQTALKSVRSQAAVTDHGAAIETLIRQADLALYQAKADGRGTWRFFNEDMHRDVDRRRHLQRDLGNAVSAGAVAVRFQPVIGLAHRDMVAVEAMPHWPQQSANEVAPSDLFAVAEQSGLAGIIAEMMMNESLACGRILPSAIRIGLDLAPSLLLDRAKIANLIDIIAKSGIKPERLEFEITEAALVDGGDRCLDHLRQLRSFGCRTAIDHFGLGATSLARLHEVPFNRLKIHGDFAARAETDPRSVSMLRAMIDMAHALGLVVTADGVVNEAQVSLLSDLGCDEAQGPFFAQPMPLAEILTFPALKIARLVPRTQHSG